jgi:DNA segregation ATPase FtsK/SpoIIIE-like protein
MTSSSPPHDSAVIHRRAFLLAALAAPIALSVPSPAAAIEDGEIYAYAVIEGGEHYLRVVRRVSHERRVSTAWLLRQQIPGPQGEIVGYNRCACLLRRMEFDGLVGPIEADNRRQVLIAPIGRPLAADPPRGAIAMASPFGILHRL